MITMEQISLDSRFETFYNLIVEWNEKFNLTTITNKQDVYLKHFFDSLLAAEYFPFSGNVLDIGSGAGLPAIPLKLILSKLNFTLIECVNKKVTFLNHVIKTLNLEKIKVLHSRIEDFKQKNFDVVTARAVAPLNILCEYALPFLKLGGTFIAYKGPLNETENATNALNILGGKIENIVNFNIEGMERNIIIIKKIKTCEGIYPRGQNKPRLNPL